MPCCSCSDRARALVARAAIALLLLLAPTSAWACPGCTPVEGRARTGYLAATLLLSFLPLLALGAIAAWVVRANRRAPAAPTAADTSA